MNKAPVLICEIFRDYGERREKGFFCESSSMYFTDYLFSPIVLFTSVVWHHFSLP